MNASPLQGQEVLIVEDDLFLRKQLASKLKTLGADVMEGEGLEAARKLLKEFQFDYAFLDVNLPDGLGTDLLKDKAFSSITAVVVMTADGNLNGAIEAIKLGATDYLAKPFDMGEIPLVLNRAKQSRQESRIQEHRSLSSMDFHFGRSLQPMKTRLQKILETDHRMEKRLSPVLIEGETGTGKTTIARWLHRMGPRAKKPLIEMNCSALPEQLAESELFGHERGAFTDARSARIGLFEAAHGGSLFLDELPSLSLAIQSKILTALEDQKIRRLGGNREIPIDTRVIAATNKNLQDLIAQGEFREDLYHRLDLFRIHIPPLRERTEGIIELVDILLEGLCAKHRLPKKSVSEKGKARLVEYAWPGNVRELSHELERALVFEESATLNFETLPIKRRDASTPSGISEDWFDPSFQFPSSGFSLEDAINRIIRHAMDQTDNNVSATARTLGVSRDYIRYRINKYRIG